MTPKQFEETSAYATDTDLNCNDAGVDCYTIDGGGGGDYLSFTDAITDLEDGSATGPIGALPLSNHVVFEVEAGTYDEKITLTTAPGASSSATITFRSASGTNTDVTLSNTLSGLGQSVVTLNKAAYVKFKNMTIKANAGSTGGRLFYMLGNGSAGDANNANHITVTGSILTGVDYNSSDAGLDYVLVLATTNHYTNGVVLTNNTMTQGSTAYYHYNNAASYAIDTVVAGNIITSTYRNGIFLRHHDGVVLTENTITIDSDNGGGSAGIYLYTPINDYQVTRNKIWMDQGTFGINIFSAAATATDHGLIANNFVRNDSGAGIQIYGSPYNDILYNSVKSSGIAFYIYKPAAAGTNNRVLNNIFYSTGSYAMHEHASFTISELDNNAYYTDGTVLNRYVATDYNCLKATSCSPAWEDANIGGIGGTGTHDVSSIEVLPVFVSSTDFHTSVSDFEGAGTPVSTTQASATVDITDDIDGDTRDTSTPDIGADEQVAATNSFDNTRPGSTETQYELQLSAPVGIDDGGYIQIIFPDEYDAKFDGGGDDITDADVSVTGTNISSTVETMDDAQNMITSTLTTGGTVSGILRIIIGDGPGSLNDLTNPSTSGSYGIGVNFFSSDGSLLEQTIIYVEIGGGSASVGATAIVNEALVMTMDSTSVSLQVDPSVNGGEDKSEGTILTVASNASGGYSIYGKLDDGSGNAQLVSGANSIASSTGENGFSYDATNNASSCSSPDGSKTFASSAGVLQNSSSQDVGYTEETDSYQHAVCYDLNVNYNTPAGVYTGTITYTVVASF